MNNDSTFRHGFVAGEDPDMTKSGTYRIVLTYFPPGEPRIEDTDLTFEYDAEAPAAETTTSDDSVTTTGAVAEPTTFQSTDDDSFRVQIPDGWVIQDIDNTGSALLEESTQGYGILAQLCPEEQQGAAALPSASGGSTNTVSSIDTSSCREAQDVIHIIRYPDLDTRLGISSEDTTTNEDMTTTDNILLYHLQKLQEVGYRSMHIVNATDMTVDLTNPQTNQIIATVPVKFVEMTYSTNVTPDVTSRGHFILTATNATPPNLGTTKGYSVFY
ncbi:MAG TPA: hypothetical protein VFZ67_04085, partial [Nitrososphaera sp.]